MSASGTLLTLKRQQPATAPSREAVGGLQTSVSHGKHKFDTLTFNIRGDTRTDDPEFETLSLHMACNMALASLANEFETLFSDTCPRAGEF
jgi:hypothetical protein